MTIYSIMPSRRNRGRRGSGGEIDSPFHALQRRTNRLFDDFFHDFSLEPFGGVSQGFVPKVNVTEDEKEIRVSAELAGVDEKDVELSLNDDVLTIKGEKKQEQETKEKNCYCVECSYGSFERSIGLGSEIDKDKVSADFKNGVLTVVLPKSEVVKSKARKIEIKKK